MLFSNYNHLNTWPLQFLRTGNYNRSYGYLHARTTDGSWWSGTVSSATAGRYLGSWTGDIYVQYSNFSGRGFALRGVGLVGDY